MAVDYYELDKTDIVRSKVVIDILDIYKYIKPFDLMSVTKNNTKKIDITKVYPSNNDAALIPKNTYQDIYYNRFS